MAKLDTAEKILSEFVQDVKLAYPGDDADGIDEAAIKWPDLVVTYLKAVKYLAVVNSF